MGQVQGDSLRLGLAQGCPGAYAELYDQFGQALYRAARTMLRQSSEAEDAVQDVFVNLVRWRNQLTEVENLPAYLFTMLRHVVARRLAQRQHERQGLRLVAETVCQPATPALADDELERAVAELPDPQREVIALKIHGELTFAQIAAILGVSINTIASRYRYALERLRSTVGEQT